MKAYLQCGSTLPTDVGGILLEVADNLLIRKYHYEKLAKVIPPTDVLALQGILELTPQNKQDLDSLKGQDSGGEAPGFNFDLDTTTGGFD
jgi:hypothetical protein